MVEAEEKSQKSPTIVRLDHARLATVYFLIQQLYHNLSLPLDKIDQQTLVDLMILAQKFQIRSLQILCEENVIITMENFGKLYDYYRNSESATFREGLLKFFVIHSQDLIKSIPIGKIEEIIRLVYSP